MQEAGVPIEIVEKELLHNAKAMLPFQFIAAAKACPTWERTIDKAMVSAMEKLPKLKGMTVVFVDVSGSMNQKITTKSEIICQDAAAALAILLDAVCDRITVFSFSDALAHVPPRRGMALRDAIKMSQPPGGTRLGSALTVFKGLNIPYDRLIVITDEQIQDILPVMNGKKYIFNIQAYKNGIAHSGDYLVISGFSEASIDYVREIEMADYHVLEPSANDTNDLED